MDSTTRLQITLTLPVVRMNGQRCTKAGTNVKASARLKTDLIFFQHFTKARIALADPPIKFRNTHGDWTEKNHPYFVTKLSQQQQTQTGNTILDIAKL